MASPENVESHQAVVSDLKKQIRSDIDGSELMWLRNVFLKPPKASLQSCLHRNQSQQSLQSDLTPCRVKPLIPGVRAAASSSRAD